MPFLGLGSNVAWTYLKLVGDDEKLFNATSFSTEALFRALGLSTSGSHLALLLFALVTEAAIVVAARMPDGDRRSFVVTIAAALLLSPIVWSHYCLLLAVPIALRTKAFNVLWVAPIGLWCVGSASLGNVWELAFTLSLVVAVCAMAAVGTAPVVRVPRAWSSVSREAK